MRHNDTPTTTSDTTTADAAQAKPRREEMEMQFRTRFALKVMNGQSSETILGAGAKAEGLDASKLLRAYKGVDAGDQQAPSEADRHELGARAAIGLADEAADPAGALRDRCRSFVPMARCVERGCEQTGSGLRADGRCHYHGARADGHGCQPYHGISGTRGRPPATWIAQGARARVQP